MIYLLTAIGLPPGGCSTVHIYTQTIHRTTQITTNLEECGPCLIFASFTLAFVLQLRKKPVRVRKTSEYSVHITKTPTHYKTYTHTHTDCGVRIPPCAWTSVCCECCVLSSIGLCDELIPRLESSY